MENEYGFCNKNYMKNAGISISELEVRNEPIKKRFKFKNKNIY